MISDEVFELLMSYNVLKKSVDDYVRLILDCWDNNYGQATYKNGILELHTGGWSENEEVYRAIQKNRMFTSGYWALELRGGHYWFAIKDRMRTPKIVWAKQKENKE